MLRLLIFGCPGSPVFELGEVLSDFYDLTYYTIEKVPDDHQSYFDDKIPEVLFDTGDFSSGSESQHMVRDPHSLRLEKELSEADASIPGSGEYEDCLTEEEHVLINNITQGIIATDIPDCMMIDWATHVVFLDADENQAIKWFMKRRKCPTCESMYHLEDKPPLVIEKCDRCGSDLIRMEKDEPLEIRGQFKEWRNSFWKFEETARKGNFKKIPVHKVKSFQDVISQVNLWVRDKISYYASNWYGKAIGGDF